MKQLKKKTQVIKPVLINEKQGYVSEHIFQKGIFQNIIRKCQVI